MQQPGTQHLPPASQPWRYPMSLPADRLSPLGTANSRRTQAPAGCCLTPTPTSTGSVSPEEEHWPLPTTSSCCGRAEVRRFVLISLSKPMKWKFPHGKSLIFECARMCWKPSQWKIPNQLPGALTRLVKPLTWEHSLALRQYLSPAAKGKAVGCSKLGMLPLHHPRGRAGQGAMLAGGW